MGRRDLAGANGTCLGSIVSANENERNFLVPRKALFGRPYVLLGIVACPENEFVGCARARRGGEITRKVTVNASSHLPATQHGDLERRRGLAPTVTASRLAHYGYRASRRQPHAQMGSSGTRCASAAFETLTYSACIPAAHVATAMIGRRKQCHHSDSPTSCMGAYRPGRGRCGRV